MASEYVLVKDTSSTVEVYHEPAGSSPLAVLTICGLLLGCHMKREHAMREFRLCQKCERARAKENA